MRNRKQDEDGILAAVAAAGGLWNSGSLTQVPSHPRPLLFQPMRDNKPQAPGPGREPQSNRQVRKGPSGQCLGWLSRGAESFGTGTTSSLPETPSSHMHGAQATPHAHPRGLTRSFSDTHAQAPPEHTGPCGAQNHSLECA